MVHSNDEKYEDLKSGRTSRFNLRDIQSITGAEIFVDAIKQRGHLVTIVSDSHVAYVGPLAEERFGVPSLALAGKPNASKLRTYLETTCAFANHSFPSEFLVVGDSKLDVHLARSLSIPSVMVNFRFTEEFDYRCIDSTLERFLRLKEGATYNCNSYQDILRILDNPAISRLFMEDPSGSASARLCKQKNANGGLTIIRSLGRQQQGLCDNYGAAGRYYKLGSANRTNEFVNEIAHDLCRYLNNQVLSYTGLRWDLITCVADKATTTPSRKMAALLQALNVNLPKEYLFEWSSEVNGSIRHEKTRNDRMMFVKKFVRFRQGFNVVDKNVIVIDDQLTTGATATAHADILLKAGARNVLFVALFYMVNEVPIEKLCPVCGKAVRIKYGPSSSSFYSCVPRSFGGTGCGWKENVNRGLS